MTTTNDRFATDDALDAVVASAIELTKNAGDRPRRISVRHGDTSIELEWDDRTTYVEAPAPLPVVRPAAPAALDPAPPAGAEPDDDTHYVRAPVVGTFYHAPEPDARPFVGEGDPVDVGTQVGIVEAMKLMNAIESDVAGRVVRVLVPDGTPVEYDQPLVALLPATREDG